MARHRDSLDYIGYTCPTVFSKIAEINGECYIAEIKQGFDVGGVLERYGRRCGFVAQENGASDVRAAFDMALEEAYTREIELERQIRNLKAKIARMEKKNAP